MIHKIKALYDAGRGSSLHAIAAALGISHNTVRKYLALSAEAIAADQGQRARAKRLDAHRNYLVHLLATYPRLIAVKVLRKLQEAHGDLEQPSPRDYLMILVGDHQPASSVTGPDAPWDVPVHVITSRPELVERFRALGFQPGLEPRRPVLGGMHELIWLLAEAFDSQRSLGSLPGSPANPAPARQVSVGTLSP